MQSSWSNNLERRHRSYIKGLDSDSNRRKREELSINIRKSKRETNVLKKRRDILMEGKQSMAPMDPLTKKKLANLPSLVQGIRSDTPSIQYECTRLIRRLLSVEKNPPIQQVVDAGVIPIFINFLKRHDYPKLQFEVCWALTNIASGTSQQTRYVVDGGSVPALIDLVKSQDLTVREQAIWALGNIAGDSVECRDLVLSLGLMSLLLEQFVPTAKDSMIRNATWTLSNMCRGKPPFHLVSPALPYLARLIYSEDEDVLSDACWALSYLSDAPLDGIQQVIEARVCKRLVQILMHPTVDVVTPALRAIGNIVTGDDVQTQVVLNCGALPCLVTLLASPKRSIRKEACWTIANITAGNIRQIQDVIDARVMPTIVNMLDHGDAELRKEACWAVSNATCGNMTQVKYLCEIKCIPPLVKILDLDDPNIIIVALEALENILKVGQREAATHGTANLYPDEIEECGGIERIEALQRHQNHDIYAKANGIIEQFFSEPADEDASILPTQQSGQFTFQLPAGAPSAGSSPFGAPLTPAPLNGTAAPAGAQAPAFPPSAVASPRPSGPATPGPAQPAAAPFGSMPAAAPFGASPFGPFTFQ
eukprot:gnl/Trimastix_PCT/2599.p1 GENE.gnl/Trimastix_PCT/2599~~gnl/Trimastix_PCT/2599.p1  ORF type:complete len:593 (+),score=183.00 gnl/Trimastix_PCT/2599:62-1840(+)